MPHDRKSEPPGRLPFCPPATPWFFPYTHSQDADLPPLEEKHLDGKFDPAKAVHEASMAPPPAPRYGRETFG